MSYLFSIIIPTLNEENFLPKLLKDLIKQKEHDFEVIVVDGKSEDKTKRLALEFEKKLKLQFLETDKRNVSYQRNLGSEYAQGKYLIFLDADNRILHNFLTKIKKEIETSKYLIMIPALIPLNGTYQDILVFRLINYAVEISHNIGKPFSTGGNFIIEKHTFEHLGGFNDKLFIAEDHEIIRRAKLCGIITKFLKDIKLQYSLRRVKKDGVFDVAKKYSIAIFHTIANKKIEDKIFEYEMGGGRYSTKAKVTKSEQQIQKIFKQFKKQIEEFILAES